MISARHQGQPWGKAALWRVYWQLRRTSATLIQEAAARAYQTALFGSEPTKSELELLLHVRRDEVWQAFSHLPHDLRLQPGGPADRSWTRVCRRRKLLSS